MLHIDCICVGKLKEDYLKNAILEYSKRLSKYCIFNIVELQDEKVPSNLSEAEKLKIIEKESNNILANIKENSYVIALDLIGGTLGMSNQLLSRANELISFSKMTFPHQLIRVFLLEQLFRGFKIQHNETYHH